MLKVVITAGAENSLEVAYLKSFFELFGIFVCERIYDYDDYDYNNENIDYFYITIMSDSLLNELKKMAQTNTGSYYELYGSVQKNADLILDLKLFPKTFSNKEEVYIFWKIIITKICETFKNGKYKRLSFDLKEMIDIFLDLNPLRNIYLLEEIIIYNMEYKVSTTKLLEEKLPKYKDSSSPYISYAYVKMQYEYYKFTNSMKFHYIELSDTEVINYHSFLVEKGVNEASIAYIMGLLCFETFHVNMLIDEFFKALLKFDESNDDILYWHDRFYRFRMGIPISKSNQKISESIHPKSIYFKLFYILGMNYDEQNKYNDARKNFEKTLQIIRRKIIYNSWSTIEIEYHCIACWKMMSLNRYYDNSEVVNVFHNLITDVQERIKSNILFKRLSNFLEDDNQLYNDMIVSAEKTIEKEIQNAKRFKC